MILEVVPTPALLGKTDLLGSICAVVDVLRATSTIITALVSGAAAVRPCLDVEEAKSEAARTGRDRYLLGGEEMGQRIAGFDLGNSPLEYLSANALAGKVIFFYTTNGTGAIRRAYAESGLPVHVAALLNLSAVSAAMVQAARTSRPKAIVILCSGRYGRPSAEDTFCAGLIASSVADRLRDLGTPPGITDSAAVAIGFALGVKGRTLEVLTSSEHGVYLRSLGFAADLEFASRLDAFNAVPVFDGERIVLMDG